MKKEKKRKYSERGFFAKLFLFFAWKLKDTYTVLKEGRKFDQYGVTLFCGRQGAGKTTAMVEYLERMRYEFPDCLILTNFDYEYQTKPMESWQDFFDVRNGDKGVIFAIDEIQNEFNSDAWRNFPETLLSEITQQRKQRIKIVATGQIYTRVAKPLREQTNDVVQCITLAGRWTFTTCFDAVDYNDTIDSPTARKKVRRLYRRSFIHDNYLRDLYDSYAKVERMKKTTFLERKERIS